MHLLPLDTLITSDAAMRSVIESQRESETPESPILVNPRTDNAGYEIADGHHRVARALREGNSHILAIVEPVPDDEPYEPPFYRFPRPPH